MNVGVNYMREHDKEDARIHYVVTDGGGQPNVVPPDAEVWYYIRANKHDDVVRYFGWVKEIADGAAKMTRTTLAAVQVDTDMFEVLPNRTLSEVIHRNLELVGAPRFTEEERRSRAGPRRRWAAASSRHCRRPSSRCPIRRPRVWPTGISASSAGLMAALGAEVLDWSYKPVCCGAAHSLIRPDIVLKLSSDLIGHAREVQADAIAVACPLCHTNLDARQFQMKLDAPMPVMYFTQLMAVALGLPGKEAALHKNLVDPRPLLFAKGLIGP